MIWAYRILVALNALVFGVSLLWSLGALAALPWRYGHPAVNTAIVIWPFPQAIGFWLAARTKSRRNLAAACWLLFVQFAIAFGIPAAAFLALLAAFPE